MLQAVEQENEELEAVEPETVEEVGGEEPETPEAEEGEASDEVEVSLSGESPSPEEAEEQRAPDWVRELRKSNREKDRRIRELEQAQSKKEEVVTVGAKPTLSACDFDEERFESELTQWHERKQKADADIRKKQDEATNAQKAWQTKLETYATQKGALKVKDFEDAEAQATELLSTTQQGVILNGAENPALLVYALGKNPKKAKELASIQDPVKFAFAVAKLETQLKVTPRKAAPLPESTVRGSGRIASDATLTRLEAEADKTGNYTKVIAYERKQQQKAST